MNPMKLLLTALAFSLAASAAVGQNMKPNGDNRELLRMGLYPPDILMRHQEEIGITSDQRKAIAGLVPVARVGQIARRGLALLRG